MTVTEQQLFLIRINNEQTQISLSAACAKLRELLTAEAQRGLFALVDDLCYALSNTDREQRKTLLRGVSKLDFSGAALPQSTLDRLELVNAYIEAATW
jgi:hypothetical protein